MCHPHVQCDVPDMLSLSMCAPFTGKDGNSPGFAAASESAKQLAAAACDGADAPLAWPLPHTRIMQSQKQGPSLLRSPVDSCHLCCAPIPCVVPVVESLVLLLCHACIERVCFCF